jgi:predicted protein tyrosine phosphatase
MNSVFPIYTLPKIFVPEFDQHLRIKPTNKTCVLSIIDPSDTPPNVPEGVLPSNRKIICFNDLHDGAVAELKNTPIHNYTVPSSEHVADLIYWFNEIRYEVDTLIVHCFGGVARSAATSFVYYNILLGKCREREALELTERTAPFSGILPNDRVVRFADEQLGYEGRMLKLIQDFNHVRYTKYLEWKKLQDK